MRKLLLLSIALLLISCTKPAKILVFTKTMGYRHKSIETGVAMFKSLGSEHGFEVDHTEDASQFNDENLKSYDLVIFLSTTGDVLDESQQQSFENFIKKGGSFMGVHAAADTEYEWPFYNKLVGAYFKSHPKQQTAEMDVLNAQHPSTQHLPKRWSHFDEWYNYKDINPDINVLINLDESSYEGGANGENHPIAWYHTYHGGKVFYTGMGHTDESYADPNFKQHLLGGIAYCLDK